MIHPDISIFLHDLQNKYNTYTKIIFQILTDIYYPHRVRPGKKTDTQQGSPTKARTFNVNKYKSTRHRRRPSLTSIDSNSSISSSSTASSYSSVQTDI